VSSEVGREKVQAAIVALQGVIADGSMNFSEVLAQLGEALNISHMVNWLATLPMFADHYALGKSMITLGAQADCMFWAPGNLDRFLQSQIAIMEVCFDSRSKTVTSKRMLLEDGLTDLTAQLCGIVVGMYELPTRHEVLTRIQSRTWRNVMAIIDEAEMVVTLPLALRSETGLRIRRWAINEAPILCTE